MKRKRNLYGKVSVAMGTAEHEIIANNFKLKDKNSLHTPKAENF